jgi:ABC-type dipeptide/oligopeptide/nickel transport system permease subunit
VREAIAEAEAAMNALLRFMTRRPNALALALIGLFICPRSARPGWRRWPARKSPAAIASRATPATAPAPAGRRHPARHGAGSDRRTTSLVWGSRSAVGFGLSVTLVTAALGVAVGLLSAYGGGSAGGLVRIARATR